MTILEHLCPQENGDTGLFIGVQSARPWFGRFPVGDESLPRAIETFTFKTPNFGKMRRRVESEISARFVNLGPI